MYHQKESSQPIPVPLRKHVSAPPRSLIIPMVLITPDDINSWQGTPPTLYIFIPTDLHPYPSLKLKFQPRVDSSQNHPMTPQGLCTYPCSTASDGSPLLTTPLPGVHSYPCLGVGLISRLPLKYLIGPTPQGVGWVGGECMHTCLCA